MQDNKNLNKKTDYLFIVFLFLLIFGIALFNFIVDPYYILRNSVIAGFNDIKTHKYTNKRTIIYSDIKITNKGKDTAFTGNCLLSHYGEGLENVAFYTITVAEIDEIERIIKNIHKIAPQIKKIYWGIFFDDLYYKDEVFDSLNQSENKNIGLDDLITLFFSWNTTKYSIETVRDSIKNKNNKQNISYIYPYREIAKKHYDKAFSFDIMSKINNIYNYTKANDIELTIYYSPMHITKKMHMYSKGIWDTNLEVKKRLAQISPFYDYSLSNQYNTQPLDENSINFIDNVHTSTDYNDMIVNDLLSDNKQIGILITKDNVDEYNKQDTQQLKDYINSHKNLADKIQSVTPEDYNVKIEKAETKNNEGI